MRLFRAASSTLLLAAAFWVVSKIGDSVVASFALLAERLDSGEPRTVSCSDGPPPILIFTDGASEGDSNTVGGFLINRDLDVVEFFACNVPDTLVKQWQVEMKHIIGPVELYGVVLARHLWHTQLVGKHCLYFVDNYAAMDACIRGSSGSPIFRQLLLSFERVRLGTGLPECRLLPMLQTRRLVPNLMGLSKNCKLRE